MESDPTRINRIAHELLDEHKLDNWIVKAVFSPQDKDLWCIRFANEPAELEFDCSAPLFGDDEFKRQIGEQLKDRIAE